jgi:competence protein ComEA
MSTELPVERLYRRLGGSAQSGRENAGDDADEHVVDAGALLPRWLPDAGPSRGGWLAAVRADPGRAGAIALAAVAAIAVLVTVFTLVRTQPTPVVSAKLPAVQNVSSTSVQTDAPSPVVDQPVVVSVVGLVNTPGLVTLTPGARVADAVSAAGGALNGADSVGLNLARRLADGEQVVVGLAPAPGGPAALGSSVSGAASPGESATTGPTGGPNQSPDTPLDLNTATAEQLDALPGVGPVTAAAIVAWRAKNGAFSSVDQLGDVDGIGPARLDRLRALVRV